MYGIKKYFYAFSTLNQRLLKNRILPILLAAALCSCHSQTAELPVLANEAITNIAVNTLSADELKRYHDTVERVLERHHLVHRGLADNKIERDATQE